MKCREVQYWLYSLRPNTSWPAELVGHLQHCPRCQRLQAQLKEIDQEINQLTSLAKSPATQEKILACIEHTPQQGASAAKPVPVPGPLLPWLRRGGLTIAAAVLVMMGWFLGHPRESPETVQTVEVVQEKIRTVEVVREKIVHVTSAADRNLIAALIKRNVILVQASQEKERLETLLEMAGDCRQHVLTLLEQGPREQLPMAIHRYEKLLREGILGQLQHATDEARPALARMVRVRLERLVEAPALATGTLPRALAEQRDALQNAARQTMELLDQNQAAALPEKFSPPPRGEPMHPVSALVLLAITLCNETNAVARAEFCAECIQQLMPCMLLYLTDEVSPQQAELGQQFGELIRFGIYTPLESAQANDPSPQTSEKVERILEKTTESLGVMEKNWQQAPAAERAGFERALEASNKGWEKGHAGKRPWSGKGKKGKADNAPGHQKKASRQSSRALADFDGLHALNDCQWTAVTVPISPCKSSRGHRQGELS